MAEPVRGASLQGSRPAMLRSTQRTGGAVREGDRAAKQPTPDAAETKTTPEGAILTLRYTFALSGMLRP